ncbi:M14 family metallopeptidase [Winogradskyella aurantiaca]|uniref:M14 family metallopeptidase n=1 Tax=Winogradskyella aurantiaca TaxID=2219558 RepID=UPI000E1C75E7|nr:M14 family metallopeptidase [Winogradskyella aurantiaca]
MNKLFLSVFTFFLAIQLSNSQQVSSPETTLGYPIGTQFSRHHQVVDYFKTVADEVPDWVQLEQYGLTNERRGLYVAYVSSPSNMNRLEEIRNNHLRRTGMAEGDATDSNLAVVWLSFNVHGNEASSSEAAMLTLYRLLTEKQAWLENTVVIIDPSINPDGRDRYVNWYNQTKSTPYNTDAESSEHNEPWPGGRPNHYLFDLNRDWAWATQVETQQRLKVYNKWMPHIHVDFHEQGYNEPYYFAPAAEPFHEIITDWQREFQTAIGKNHAKYFDKEGWLFFTRERFDLLYPSYGDTYPTYMGAIGMTYEQGGHGRAGLGVKTDEGEILTLDDRLTHHTTTALSTVEIASQNAERLNEEFEKFFDNSGLKYKSYALSGDSDKIERLKSLLDKHDIQYESATGSKASGYKYSIKSQGSIDLNDQSMVVHTNQPKGKMVKVLFEPDAKLSDSLTYDITAWSLPYAYGLDAVASTSRIGSEIKFKETSTIPALTNAYGYVSKWTSMKDAQFLSALLKADFRVRFTEKPFQSNGQTFDRGSLIITRGDNQRKSDFVSELNVLAQKHKQILSTIASGFSQTTPDIGSPDIKLLNKLNVAILSGEGTSSLSYGSIWHFFENELHYPLTSINTDDLNGTNLNKYQVLIMPDGYYSRVVNDNVQKKLNDWVSNGGKIIAISSALRSFAGKDGFALKYKDGQGNGDDNVLTPYADRERAYANNLITGAIFETTLDNTHPLAFGYPNNYFSLKLGSSAYDLMDSGFNVGYLESNEVYSGFAGQNAVANLNGTLVFGEERKGSGSLVYMVDNPLFRSFWDNGKLFLVNAIFFVNHNAFEL